MADLTANFAADFSKFTDACAKAEVSLKGIESGAANVEGQLTKMADSLSGTKIIQQATVMAEAVERVGGVSTLTAKELARIGGTAEEAAEKLRKLGQDVPPGIQQIADASIKAREELAKTSQSGIAGFETLGASVKTLAGALGLAFGAGAVIGGIKNIIGGAVEMASAIHDTSEKLGVSAEKWQGWVAAVEAGGGSADDVSKAITTLNRNIVEGSKETQRAAHDLGLEWTDLRDMKIEDTFETVVTAMMKMPNQQVAIALGAKLMGKSVSEMEAAIKDDMVKTGASVQKMSDDTVAQLAAAGDAWESLSRTVVIVTGGIIAATTQMVTQASSSWKEFGLFVTDAAKGGVAFAIDQQQVRKAIEETKNQVLIYGPTLEQLNRTVHKSAEEIKAEEDALKKNKAAWEAHRQAIQGVADVLTGRHVAQEVRDLQEALAAAQQQGGLTAEGWRELDVRLRKLVDAGAQLPPELQRIWEFHKTLNDIIPQVNTGLTNLGATLPDVTAKWRAAGEQQDHALMSLTAIAPVVTGLSKDLLKFAADVQLSKPIAEVDTLGQSLKELAQSFATLSQVGGDSFGGLMKGVGTAVAGLSTVQTALKQISALQEGAKTKGWDASSVAGMVAAYASVAGAVYQVWAAFDAYYKKQEQITRIEHDASQTAYDFGEGFSRVSDQIAVAVRSSLDHLLALQGGIKQASDILTLTLEAEALNLSAIIGDLGGVTAKNLPFVVEHFTALFDVVQKGGSVGAQAMRQLEAVLPDVAAAMTNASGVWDDALKTLIADAQAAGIELAGVGDLIKGQQDALGSGVMRMTAATGQQAASYTDLKQKVDDATKALADLVEQGAEQDEITAATEAVTHAQADLAGVTVTSQDEFDRLSRIALAAFNGLVASGVDVVTAMAQIGPGIDALIASADAFGLSGSTAFDQLSRWRDLTKDNEALLGQIGGLNDIMASLANLGSLTADTFADLQAQGTTAFEKLTAAGFTESEALVQMKPFLQNLIDLHNKKGYAIDENTQKLIAQGIEQGILSEDEISTNDILMEGIAALIEALGGKIPAAWETAMGKAKKAAKDAEDALAKTGKAGEDAAAATTDAWSDVDIRVPVHFDVDTPPDFGGGTPSPPDLSAANEGFFRSPTTVRVGDDPYGEGEYVLHKRTVDALMAASPVSLSAGGRRGGGGGGTVIVMLDGRMLAQAVVPELEGEIRRLGFGR